MSRYEDDMMKSVIKRDRPALADFVRMGCSVNFQTNDGSTLLMRAVYRNDKDMVDDLLKYGADPNLADGTGLSPLMIASDNGYYSIVARLLQSGAKVEQRDNNGTAALSYAAKAGGEQTNIVKLLIKHGADVNALDGGIFKSPPLFKALAEGAYDVAGILLQNGAKIEARDGDGNTIGHYLNDVGKTWLKNQPH